MSNKQACVDPSTTIPPHGVIFVHGEVLQEYLDFFRKKGVGVKVESIGQSFKVIWSKKLKGVKLTKSTLKRLQGPWIYPYSYKQMAKQLITHRYEEGLGQFLYVGRPAKAPNIPYDKYELYEKDAFSV